MDQSQSPNPGPVADLTTAKTVKDLLLAQDAEIDRMTEQAIKFRDMCLEKDAIIIKLADALERIPIALTPPDRELVQSARATVILTIS